MKINENVHIFVYEHAIRENANIFKIPSRKIYSLTKKVLQVIMYSSLTCCKKMRINTFCQTELKYFYNEVSKNRYLKK